MKLKNKLLPLVGIGTACAAVAPIALTSCNNSSFVDLLQKYHSTITDIPGSDTWSEDKAIETYFNNAKANPNIFIDDYYWYTSFANTKYVPGAASNITMIMDCEKISNVSFNKWILQESDPVWTISFEKQMNIDYTNTSSVYPSILVSDEFKINGTIKCVNAPVTLGYNGYDGLWYISVVDPRYNGLSSWESLWDEDIEASITFDASLHLDDETTVGGVSYVQSNDFSYKMKLHDEDTFNAAIEEDTGLYYLDEGFKYVYWEATLFCYSHYLFNIIEEPKP